MCAPTNLGDRSFAQTHESCDRFFGGLDRTAHSADRVGVAVDVAVVGPAAVEHQKIENVIGHCEAEELAELPDTLLEMEGVRLFDLQVLAVQLSQGEDEPLEERVALQLSSAS